MLYIIAYCYIIIVDFGFRQYQTDQETYGWMPKDAWCNVDDPVAVELYWFSRTNHVGELHCGTRYHTMEERS